MLRTIGRRLSILLLFGTVAAVYTICCAPDFTWTNVDCDGFYYYAQAAHLTEWGANPVYAGWGHTLSSIPLGTLPWRVAFFCSVLPAIITAILVFYVVRKKTDSKLAPYVGVAALAASPILISQATIHEVYSLTAMFCVAAYLAHVYRKLNLSMVLLGLAICTYWLTAIAVTIAFVLWVPQKRRLLILVPFAVAPLVFVRYFGTYDILNYWGGLPSVFLHGELAQLPTRVVESMRILVVMMGVAWIPAFLYLRNWRVVLPFAVILGFPIAYLLTAAVTDAYVQLYVAVPFVAIAAGLGTAKLHARYLAPAILVCSCIMLLILPLRWDIGRTLDETPTTARRWLTQLETVPNDSIIVCSRQLNGVEDSLGTLTRSAVRIINAEQNKNLTWVYIEQYADTLDRYGERYRLYQLGLKTPWMGFVGEHQVFYDTNAVMLAEANDTRAYRTVVTEPETFECELIEITQSLH